MEDIILVAILSLIAIFIVLALLIVIPLLLFLKYRSRKYEIILVIAIIISVFAIITMISFFPRENYNLRITVRDSHSGDGRSSVPYRILYSDIFI